ncbi:MAG: hypothetical protein HYY02_03155 [Chloroflexi bacterium]|nr:hypothetical protein [Chloroflexota bacterium]
MRRGIGLMGLMIMLALAVTPSVPASADDAQDLAAARARFENLTKEQIEAAGYRIDAFCIPATVEGLPAEVGAMGIHAVKPQFFGDNVVKGMDPEILLLDNNFRVIGIEYETEDLNAPVPSLFGHKFELSGPHPGHWHRHYMLHIYFQPNGQFLVSTWNPTLRCAPGSTPPGSGQPAPSVRLDMAASREGRTVTYSMTLVNGSGAEIRDIFLAGTVPAGTSFAGATAMPPRSGFKGVEGGSAGFLAESVPAWSTLGPFSYQVTLGGGAPGMARGWTHWGRPWDASTTSMEVAVPGTVPPIPVDFTPVASGGFPQLPKGDWAYAVLEVNLPPGFVLPLGDAPPLLFYQTGGWLSLGYADGSSRLTGPGSAFFEARPHSVTAMGNSPAKGIIFALVPLGAPLPLPPGVTPLAMSPRLEGLRDGPYVFLLGDVKLHPGVAGWNHYHPGPAAAYVIEGTAQHAYGGKSTTEGPGSVWFEQVGVHTDTYALGDKPTRIAAALLFPADQAPAIPVQ